MAAGDLTDRIGGARTSLAFKAPVTAATTANVTLSGTQTIDGVALSTDERVLIKDQTDASENGIYLVKASDWVRDKDWNGDGDITKGTQVFVGQGSENALKAYAVSSTGTDIGTDNVSLAIVNTFGGTLVQIDDASADHAFTFAGEELAADRTIGLPTLSSSDTFVFEAHTQTLTNKTLTSPTLTTPSLTLQSTTTPTPTTEADVWWDSDNDRIVVGDGSGQKIFGSNEEILVRAANGLTPHEGLVVTRASVSTIDIDADAVVLNSTDGAKAKRFASLNETLDVTSTGANGLDSGSTEEPDAWYYLFAIGAEDGTLDSLASTSTSPTLPSSYIYAGLVGTAYNTTDSDFKNFKQRGNHVAIEQTEVVSLSSNTDYTATSLTKAASPLAATVAGNLLTGTSSGQQVTDSFVSPSGSTTTSDFGETQLRDNFGNASLIAGHFECQMDSTGQQVFFRVAGTDARGSLRITSFSY